MPWGRKRLSAPASESAVELAGVVPPEGRRRFLARFSTRPKRPVPGLWLEVTPRNGAPFECMVAGTSLLEFFGAEFHVERPYWHGKQIRRARVTLRHADLERVEVIATLGTKGEL